MAGQGFARTNSARAALERGPASAGQVLIHLGMAFPESISQGLGGWELGGGQQFQQSGVSDFFNGAHALHSIARGYEKEFARGYRNRKHGANISSWNSRPTPKSEAPLRGSPVTLESRRS